MLLGPQAGIEFGQLATQRARLVVVGVPAGVLDEADARPVRRGHEARRRGHRLRQALAGVAAAAAGGRAFHASVDLREGRRELRVGGIQGLQTLPQERVDAFRQGRRPGGHVATAAHRQRHDRRQRQPSGTRHRRHAAIEPAAGAAAARSAVLHAILRFEMRALPIRRRHRDHRQQLPARMQLRHEAERAVQCEVAIERMRCRLPRRTREITAQCRERGIAYRLHGMQAVHAAAQQHQQEAGIGCRGRGQRESRQSRHRQRRRAGAEESASVECHLNSSTERRDWPTAGPRLAAWIPRAATQRLFRHRVRRRTPNRRAARAMRRMRVRPAPAPPARA